MINVSINGEIEVLMLIVYFISLGIWLGLLIGSISLIYIRRTLKETTKMDQDEIDYYSLKKVLPIMFWWIFFPCIGMSHVIGFFKKRGKK